LSPSIRPARFKPAWWLPGPHLQTIWPALFRKRPFLNLARERVELPDGDFIDLAWTANRPGPCVLVLHGLEGSLRSHYAAGILHSLDEAGFRAAFMHFRGCSGEPNRLARGYHSGDTGDLTCVLEHIQSKHAQPVSAAIGFSLGGNVLLKWLGEHRDRSFLKAAVAVSVPFRLSDAAERLELGWSRLYRGHLLRRMRAAYRRKFARLPSPLVVEVDRLRSFYEFDDKITAPLHGFKNADDYYHRASSRRYLKGIHTKTLILHARDDPFMWPGSVPEDGELSGQTVLELSEKGGHVGFVSGRSPWRAHYWLDKRIIDFLRQSL